MDICTIIQSAAIRLSPYRNVILHLCYHRNAGNSTIVPIFLKLVPFLYVYAFHSSNSLVWSDDCKGNRFWFMHLVQFPFHESPIQNFVCVHFCLLCLMLSDTFSHGNHKRDCESHYKWVIKMNGSIPFLIATSIFSAKMIGPN